MFSLTTPATKELQLLEYLAFLSGPTLSGMLWLLMAFAIALFALHTVYTNDI